MDEELDLPCRPAAPALWKKCRKRHDLVWS